jgi:hypothetical protein
MWNHLSMQICQGFQRLAQYLMALLWRKRKATQAMTGWNFWLHNGQLPPIAAKAQDWMQVQLLAHHGHFAEECCMALKSSNCSPAALRVSAGCEGRLRNFRRLCGHFAMLQTLPPPLLLLIPSQLRVNIDLEPHRRHKDLSPKRARQCRL